MVLLAKCLGQGVCGTPCTAQEKADLSASQYDSNIYSAYNTAIQIKEIKNKFSKKYRSNAMEELKMYQVSTLQALLLGHTRKVSTVGDLRRMGSTGLGTFVAVDGEMIFIDGHCFRATDDGSAVEMPDETGTPFACVCNLKGNRKFELGSYANVDDLKAELNNRIEEDFGLNSMHIVRIDGEFDLVDARSEMPYVAVHMTLKDMLATTQKAFKFENISGSLVCVYYPDYMDGINAAGWHFHFISDDRKLGGHVFDVKMKRGSVLLDKISMIELKLPTEPIFDTYSLKGANDDVKSVEQGKG
jgi:acetolactate decarboxylase